MRPLGVTKAAVPACRVTTALDEGAVVVGVAVGLGGVLVADVLGSPVVAEGVASD